MIGCEAPVDAHVTERGSYPTPCHVAALSAAASAHSLEACEVNWHEPYLLLA